MLHLNMDRDMPVSAERLWHIFAERYAAIDGWAQGVYASKARAGDSPVGAPVLGRECLVETGKHPFIETIEAYEPEVRRIRYRAESKSLPGFMRRITNQWQFEDLGNGTSRVKVRGQIDVAAPFSWFMGGLIKRQFSKTMEAAFDDLGHFADTGQASPAKQAFDAQPRAAQARSAFL